LHKEYAVYEKFVALRIHREALVLRSRFLGASQLMRATRRGERRLIRTST